MRQVFFVGLFTALGLHASETSQAEIDNVNVQRRKKVTDIVREHKEQNRAEHIEENKKGTKPQIKFKLQKDKVVKEKERKQCVCPQGFSKQGSLCHSESIVEPSFFCKDGYEALHSTCIREEPLSLNCDPGWVDVAGVCRRTSERPVIFRCPENSERVNLLDIRGERHDHMACTVREPVSTTMVCPQGKEPQDGECPYTTCGIPEAYCDDDYDLRGGKCIREMTLSCDDYLKKQKHLSIEELADIEVELNGVVATANQFSGYLKKGAKDKSCRIKRLKKMEPDFRCIDGDLVDNKCVVANSDKAVEVCPALGSVVDCYDLFTVVPDMLCPDDYELECPRLKEDSSQSVASEMLGLHCRCVRDESSETRARCPRDYSLVDGKCVSYMSMKMRCPARSRLIGGQCIEDVVVKCVHVPLHEQYHISTSTYMTSSSEVSDVDVYVLE